VQKNRNFFCGLKLEYNIFFLKRGYNRKIRCKNRSNIAKAKEMREKVERDALGKGQFPRAGELG
jgi:hypothetical protein